jgi:hypothetical protein
MCIAALKAFEQLRVRRRRNTRAGVAYFQNDGHSDHTPTDQNARPYRRVLLRIAQQIQDNLLQSPGVAIDGQRRRQI